MLIGITICGMLLLALAFALSRRNIEALDLLIWSITLWIFGYIVCSGGLILLNWFSVTKAATCTLLISVASAIICYIKSSGLRGISVNWGFKSSFLPLLVAVLGSVAVLSSSFSFAGMGQDEGVYQTEALCYINGMTERQFDYNEFYKLTNLGLGDEYLENIKAGPNMAGAYAASDCNISEILTGVQRDCISENSSVFHGIHTFSSVMAWFGMMLGISNMTKVNALLFGLCILWLYKIGKKLSFNLIGIAASLTCFVLCPQVLWCAKSALTEIGLTLIWLVFIYAIITREKLSVYLSSLCVTVYGFYHLSLYVFMPLFAFIYVALFFYNADKTYLKGLILSSIGFIITLWYSLITACKYSVENFSPVAKAFITKENACVYATGAALFLIILAIVLMMLSSNKSMRFFAKLSSNMRSSTGSKLFAWIIRCVMALALLYVVYRFVTGKANTEILPYNTLIAFALLTGFIFFALAVLSLLIRADKWSTSANRLILAVLFVYCIMVFANFLHPQIEYFYYFSRYVTMYIPMIGLIAGDVITRFTSCDKNNKRFNIKRIAAVCLCIISAVLMFPHTKFVIENQDDSRYDWKNITDVNELVAEQNIQAAFIRPDLLTAYYYDLKSIGVDVYPITDNFEVAYDEIASWYSGVVIIDGVNPYDYQPDGTCTYTSHAALAGYPVMATLNNTMTEDLGFYRDARTGLPNGMYSASYDIVIYRYK